MDFLDITQMEDLEVTNENKNSLKTIGFTENTIGAIPAALGGSEGGLPEDIFFGPEVGLLNAYVYYDLYYRGVIASRDDICGAEDILSWLGGLPSYYDGNLAICQETVEYMYNHEITKISLPQLELLYFPNGFEPEDEPKSDPGILANTRGLRTQTNELESQTGSIHLCLDTALGELMPYFKIVFDEFIIIIPIVFQGDSVLPYGIDPSDNSSVDISTFCFQGIVYASIHERISDTEINQIVTHNEEELGE